jgi:hypothetical protein
MVKSILTGTATDIGAAADQQGAGLVNAYAAVKAAQQMPGATSFPADGDSVSLIPTQTQLDLTGQPGSVVTSSVDLYNTSNSATTVTGSTRSLGAATQIGSVYSATVSAPAGSQVAGAVLPQEGATAAPSTTFTVAAGTDHLTAEMVWPDPTHDNVLSFTLTDPTGALTQISYDYGTPKVAPAVGSVPNSGRVDVDHPVSGKWTVTFHWANGRDHLQSAANVPGAFTGKLQFRALASHWVTGVATASTITIPAHGTATVPLAIQMAATPGDNPESIQFVAANGAVTSLPVARRTFIPSTGGEFTTQIIGTVGRGTGQVSTFNINVPAGQSSLDVAFSTPDGSSDNKFRYYLVNPAGKVAVTTNAPATNATSNTASLHVAAPAAGVWEVDVILVLSVSGNEFEQTVTGSTASTNETVSTTVTQQGALTLSVANAAPVILPTPTLTADGTGLTSTGSINPVTVTDTRQSSPGWVASGQLTAFTNTLTSDTIPAADLGWAPNLIDESAGQTVVAGPVVAPGVGLASAQQLGSAAAGHSNGTAHLGAGLSLLAPTSTALGTYNATLTLTAI